MHLCHQLILGFSGTFSLPIYHSVKVKKENITGKQKNNISLIGQQNRTIKSAPSKEQHYKII